MARQTVWGTIPIQWIVVDDGIVPITPTLGQQYVRRQREPVCTGAESLCRNLLTALPLVKGDPIICIEHDDRYAPDHLERLLAQLAPAPILIAGDPLQRYYHVGHRVWRVWNNRGASLCQTGFTRELLSTFREVIEGRLQQKSYGVDTVFWARIPRERQSLEETRTVVGIKGLPGRAGLGLGHRPDRHWTDDTDLLQLRDWVGDDVDLYAPLYRPAPPPAIPREATRPKGPPRLVSRYFAGANTNPEVFRRLARVLEWTAQQHCCGWAVDVCEVPAAPLSAPLTEAARLAYEHNAQKLDEWARVVETAADGECLALVDADTIILRPLDPVWGLAFDIALTARARGARLPINSGVVFVRVSEATRAFFRHWRDETRRMLATPAHHAPWHRKYGGITQAALGFIRETRNTDGLLVRELSCQEWNCDETAWPMCTAFTRIVHIKSGLRGLIFGQPGPALRSPIRELAGMWRRLERSAQMRP